MTSSIHLWEMQNGINEQVLHFIERQLIIDENLISSINFNTMLIVGFIGIYVIIKVYKFLKKRYSVVKK